MDGDYAQMEPDSRMENDVRQLVRLAVREDLERQIDWTTVALVSPDARGRCEVRSREPGICCGMVVLPWIIDEMDADLVLETFLEDGHPLQRGSVLAALEGSSRDLLTVERTLLNFLGRMCGVASWTQRYVRAIGDHGARLYDTRKTTPGWRRLDKYAVRCGGGHNHRTGLYDGFLIKDNHLALAGDGAQPLDAGEAVRRVQRWSGAATESMAAPKIVEVEVDSLEQFRTALAAGPDIILLDNFTVDQLREAVRIRQEQGSGVELECSGGVTLETIAELAGTGVDRISCGALTHAARWLDLGLDWN